MNKSAKKIITSITFVLLLAYAASLYADGVYDREKASNDIDWPFREYALYGSWHVQCSLHFTPPKYKSRTCELRYTDGSKDNSGRYETFGTSPVVEINALGDRPPYLLIKMGYIYSNKGNYEASFEVDGTKFEKVVPRSASYRGWHNSEAVPVINSFISGNVAKYDYVANPGRIEDTVSLKGFTNAWNHAVKFTGYDPLSTGS